MAVQFEFYKNPMREKEEEISYHPRIVNLQQVSTQKLAAEIHSATTFTKAEVEAMLMELSRCMGNHLREGKRVHLDGIGYFQIALQATEPIHSTTTHANKVEFKSVNFRADVKLKSELVGMHVLRSKYRPHSASLSEAEIDKRLTKYFETHSVLTRTNLQSLCLFTRSMASRHIRRLQAQGNLQNIGIRSQPIYVPSPGFYGK